MGGRLTIYYLLLGDNGVKAEEKDYNKEEEEEMKILRKVYNQISMYIWYNGVERETH